MNIIRVVICDAFSKASQIEMMEKEIGKILGRKIIASQAVVSFEEDPDPWVIEVSEGELSLLEKFLIN